MKTKTPIAFLPGVGASADFWKPVAQAMPRDRDYTFHSWPGLGNEAPSPAVNSPGDLVKLVIDDLDEPTDLVSQSMGGVIAVQVALQRPDLVRRLVLATTSGGVPMADHKAEDWRTSYRNEYPNAPPWLYSDWGDLTERLMGISIPVLLIWGDSDPISPISVGERLEQLIPGAVLKIVKGGAHDLARSHVSEVATLIDTFLSEQ
jgi:pimeloyl-ACP methyl ester carboxylesterase